MSGFLSVVNRGFAFLFQPLQSAPPLVGLLVVSWLTGVLMVLLFRFTSNQKELRRVKNRMQAHLLAVRLFQEQVGVVLRAQWRLLGWTLAYLRHSMRPLAVVFLPLVILLLQLDAHLGWVPARPGDPLVLTARVAAAASLDQVSLRLPAGLELSAPPVRIPEDKEIAWRIQAAQAGEFTLEVEAAGQRVSKKVIVATDLARVSARRGRAGLFEEFLHPAEPPLPEGSILETIQVHYRRRTINLGLFQTHWLVPFFVLSLLSGYAMKGLLRTEI